MQTEVTTLQLPLQASHLQSYTWVDGRCLIGTCWLMRQREGPLLEQRFSLAATAAVVATAAETAVVLAVAVTKITTMVTAAAATGAETSASHLQVSKRRTAAQVTMRVAR